MATLEETLDHQFEDTQLLRLALTHPSAANHNGTPQPDNQRLEFLGDAVLGLVLTEELYRRHPDESEGALTPLRASLVSGVQLAELAADLKLGDALVLGPGEEAAGGRQREGALADAFEALVGAIYLDGGLEPCRKFLLQLYADLLDELQPGNGNLNPKGELQEILQDLGEKTPNYELRTEDGPDHNPRFVVEVCWQGRILGCGQGTRKKTAEADAARDALRNRRWESGEA